MRLLSIKSTLILMLLVIIVSNKNYSQQLSSKQQGEIKGNLDLMDSLYTRIVRSYVEKIDPEKLMQKGITSMLAALDPFTHYQSKDEADEFKVIMNGKFGGAGMVIREVNTQIVIGQVFQDFPADKAGLIAGDIILTIDSLAAPGKSVFDIIPFLRGVPGSTVKLLIKRPGRDAQFTVNIIREEIKLSNVPWYGMIHDDIGYIFFTGFTKDCSETVKSALTALKSQHVVKGLVLDLRDNPGGLVNEAVKISNFFLEKGNTIVRIRNKEEDSTEYATHPAIDAGTPMVILTNANTASAAEILTGAIQDNDRGVVIGQRTFGKGLVGVIYHMPSASQLVLTVAHYYTPSGRCIQAKNYPGNGGTGIAIPDSLKKTFTTKNGRSLKDAEGITPDIVMTRQAQPPITKWLLDSNFIFNYAIRYRIAHPSIPSPEKFHLSETGYNGFLVSLKNTKFTYQTVTEENLDKLRKTALAEGYTKSIEQSILKLKEQFNMEKQKDIDRFKGQIKKLLEEEIAGCYYYDKGRIQAGLKNDPELKKAIEILLNQEVYKKTLNIR